MTYEAFLFIIAVIISAALLFCMVYMFIMYTDLESDHVNPIDFCSRVNQFVLPEMALHAGLTLLFLLSFSFIAFFLNVPLLVWHARKYMSRKYRYDATDIFRTLSQHKRDGLIKLVFYLLSFFYYLYRMILGLLEVK